MEKRSDDDIWKNLYQLPLLETPEKISDEEIIEKSLWYYNFPKNFSIKKIFPEKKHVLSHQVIHARLIHIVIEDSCNGYKPHNIPNYLFEIASQFNKFYRDCPVLPEKNDNLRKARLSLVNATRIVLKNGLDILGIVAPKEM